MPKAPLEAAVAAAVTGTQQDLGLTAPPENKTVPVDNTTVQPPAKAPEAAAAPADAVKSSTAGTDVQDPTPDARGTAPSEFMGSDLSKLPDDASRWAFIDAMKESTKAFAKLQRENAALRAEAAPAATPVAPAAPAEPELDALSDEDIAAALGIDLEETADPNLAAVTVKMARAFGDISAKLDALVDTTTTSTARARFDKDLSRLEERFGPLPEDIVGDDLWSFAEAEGIKDAEVAYWRAMGPVRAEVAKALEARLTEDKRTQKVAATSPRPTTTTDVQPPGLQSKNAKDAVAEAAREAIKTLGIRFRDE